MCCSDVAYEEIFEDKFRTVPLQLISFQQFFKKLFVVLLQKLYTFSHNLLTTFFTFHFVLFFSLHTNPRYSTEKLFETVDSDGGDFHDWKWEQRKENRLSSHFFCLKIKLFLFVCLNFILQVDFSFYNLYIFGTPLRIRANAMRLRATRRDENESEMKSEMLM